MITFYFQSGLCDVIRRAHVEARRQQVVVSRFHFLSVSQKEVDGERRSVAFLLALTLVGTL